MAKKSKKSAKPKFPKEIIMLDDGDGEFFVCQKENVLSVLEENADLAEEYVAVYTLKGVKRVKRSIELV